MADARLKIIVELINNAKGELAGLTKDLAGVDAAAKKGSTSFADVGMALGKLGLIAGGAAVALKKVYDLGSAGADIEQTRESFERLGISIEDLRAASLGTVDDMTLMAGVMTLVAGTSGELQAGLLAAAPQLLEIAKAANKLNPTLGDTAFMYESLATGIKRGSKLVIDNTGIVFGAQEAYDTYAETVGKTADELTETEKKLAFLNATLETGQRIIEQGGGSLEAQGDAYQQLGAQAKNATDELKELADTYTGPVVGALARGLGLLNDAIDAHGAWRVLIAVLSGDQATLSALMAEAAAEEQKLAVNAEAAAKGTAALAEGFRDVGASAPIAEKVLRDISGFVAQGPETFEEYKAAMDAALPSIDEFLEAQEEMTRANQALIDSVDFAVGSKLTEALEQGRDKLENYGLSGELEAQLAAGDLTPDELDALKTQLGDVTGEIYDTINAMREMSAQFVLGLIEMQIAADGKITETEAAIYTQFAYHSGLIDELAVQQSDAVMGILADMEAGILSEQEAMRLLLDSARNVTDEFTEAQDAGSTAMENIAAATSAPIEGLGRIEAAARDAQAMIDAMHGKTIDIGINITEHRRVGDTGQPNQFSAAGGVSGGGWTMVGERGPEMVNLPQGASVMSAPVTNNVTNNYNTTVNTRATAGTYAQDIAMARAMG